MKTYILLLSLSFFSIALFSQESALSKGAVMLSGTANFSSSGGELFEDMDKNKQKEVALTPSVNVFVVDNLFIGLGAQISTLSQGEMSASTSAFGPQLGYVFGSPNNEALPFIHVGLRRYNMSFEYVNGLNGKIVGSDLFLGFGMIIPVRSHIGIVLEGSYHTLSLKDEDSPASATGDVLNFSVGIVGLLF